MTHYGYSVYNTVDSTSTCHFIKTLNSSMVSESAHV